MECINCVDVMRRNETVLMLLMQINEKRKTELKMH